MIIAPLEKAIYDAEDAWNAANPWTEDVDYEAWNAAYNVFYEELLPQFNELYGEFDPETFEQISEGKMIERDDL